MEELGTTAKLVVFGTGDEGEPVHTTASLRGFFSATSLAIFVWLL